MCHLSGFFGPGWLYFFCPLWVLFPSPVPELVEFGFFHLPDMNGVLLVPGDLSFLVVLEVLLGFFLRCACDFSSFWSSWRFSGGFDFFFFFSSCARGAGTPLQRVFFFCYFSGGFMFFVHGSGGKVFFTLSFASLESCLDGFCSAR